MARTFSRCIVWMAAVATMALAAPARADEPPIRIGYAISRTGPFAPGAQVTQEPSYLLWADQINAAGGIAVKGGRKRKVELNRLRRSQQINPYLNFNGTAEKAMKLYESALDAKVGNVMRFGDAAAMPVAPADKNRVMHAVLQLGAGVIMLSDTMPNAPVGADGNVHISLDFEDADDMTKKFDALAAGGNVTMPLNDTFWGARFGMLTDVFGIRWMFNCEKKKG